jgi:hypothetical protein
MYTRRNQKTGESTSFSISTRRRFRLRPSASKSASHVSGAGTRSCCAGGRAGATDDAMALAPALETACVRPNSGRGRPRPGERDAHEYAGLRPAGGVGVGAGLPPLLPPTPPPPTLEAAEVTSGAGEVAGRGDVSGGIVACGCKDPLKDPAWKSDAEGVAKLPPADDDVAGRIARRAATARVERPVGCSCDAARPQQLRYPSACRSDDVPSSARPTAASDAREWLRRRRAVDAGDVLRADPSRGGASGRPTTGAKTNCSRSSLTIPWR